MDKELTEKLSTTYPGLFEDLGGNPQDTCMAWGIDCGDGWYFILEQVCRKLSEFDGIKFEQIKEKFGGLRIYIGNISDENWKEAYNIIDNAEKLSYITCEVCGNPGKLRGKGYIQTLCDECNKK